MSADPWKALALASVDFTAALGRLKRALAACEVEMDPDVLRLLNAVDSLCKELERRAGPED